MVHLIFPGIDGLHFQWDLGSYCSFKKRQEQLYQAFVDLKIETEDRKNNRFYYFLS